MQTSNENRVLSRRMARHLSAEELDKLLGKGSKNQFTQVPSIPHFPDP
jgi:hypothetical protein